MNFSKKNILVLTDGSQGMISQVMGLSQQLSNNIQSLETKIIFPWSKLQPGLLPVYSWIFLNNLNLKIKPDIIISCGRKSVYLSIFLKKKYKELINIHIQNPKISFNNFNYVIAPEHDNIKGNNVISSIGALHKFDRDFINKVNDKEFSLPKKNIISIILGGDNNHYKFSLAEIEKLIIKIKEIKKIYPNYNILIISSRRTPQKIKEILSENLKNIAIVGKEGEKNPYTYALKYSSFFVISSDSTSMISECAITGKPIFIFHLPFKRRSKRIENFHKQFEKLKITKNLEKENHFSSWTYNSLNESKRIASIVKERIIKEVYESK